MKPAHAVRLTFAIGVFTPTAPAATPASAESTRPDPAHLFKLHCAQCHGSHGEGGRGPALAVPMLSRAATPQSVAQTIRQGVPATEMPGLFLPPGQIELLANWVLKLGETPLAASRGEARRGEELYNTRGKCASCHAIRGVGGVTGPDLTTIGIRRGGEFLRRSLVDPEADVPENFGQYRWHTVIPDHYLQVRVRTKGGQEIPGVRLNEDPFNIQIRDLNGQIHSLAKADLAELHRDRGKSLMPSYRDMFSPAELDDLVAYLLSLRTSP